MRAAVWKNLFRERRWLEGATIVIPKDVEVLLNFLGDGHPSHRNLEWIRSTEGEFLVFEPNPGVLQYYLWEDLASIAVHPKR